MSQSSLVNGIGGAFLFSNDPKRLADWYIEHLGLQFEGGGSAYYQTFYGLDPRNTAQQLDTTFSIIKAKADFPNRTPADEPASMYGDQPFMVNFRVDDLTALVDQLRQKNVEVLKEEDEGYARFAWVRDADGNRIELYEPTPPPAAS